MNISFSASEIHVGLADGEYRFSNTVIISFVEISRVVNDQPTLPNVLGSELGGAARKNEEFMLVLGDQVKKKIILRSLEIFVGEHFSNSESLSGIRAEKLEFVHRSIILNEIS